MPAMGPDCDHAAKQGRETAEAMFAMMVDAAELWDLTNQDPNSGYPGIKKKIADWAKLKEAFIKSVEDIFVEDACNSF